MSLAIAPLPVSSGLLSQAASGFSKFARMVPLPVISEPAEARKPSSIKPLPSADSSFFVPEVPAPPVPLSAIPQTSDTTPGPKPVSLPGPAPFSPAPQSKAPGGNLRDYTDADLRQALEPIVSSAVRHLGEVPGFDAGANLEPMLRATIRRALAENHPGSRPFEAPGAVDRLMWQLTALFTSRTYEEVVFEKTKRFQVEEAYLFDVDTLSMISFASTDPARHASPKRANIAAHKIGQLLRAAGEGIRTDFNFEAGCRAISRQGDHVVLTLLIRGLPGEIVFTDLDYALRRIENQFRDRFADPATPLLAELQPYLEDCLLIQAPASLA